jgi:hypothetical protein
VAGAAVRHFRVGAWSCGETGSVGLSGRLEGHPILNLDLKRVARRALDARKRDSDSDRNKASA